MAWTTLACDAPPRHPAATPARAKPEKHAQPAKPAEETKPVPVPVPIAKAAPTRVDAAPIPDCKYTLERALRGSKAPQSILAGQRLVTVRYYSFDHLLHQGQIIVDKDLVSDVQAVFREIEASHFPIGRVIPVRQYDWSDDASVAGDNTSGFNYRDIPETHTL